MLFKMWRSQKKRSVTTENIHEVDLAKLSKEVCRHPLTHYLAYDRDRQGRKAFTIVEAPKSTDTALLQGRVFQASMKL